MEMTAKDIELTIYRSGLLSPKARWPLVAQCAKDIRKHAGAFDRARLALCNGVPHWNQKTQQIDYSLTEEESDAAYEALEAAEAAMRSAFNEILKRGTLYDFRRDPRGAVVRFVNPANTRDVWVS